MRLCSIASGSSGNCIYVGSEHTHLLVDAGISGKRIEESLGKLEISAEMLSGILITHEHVDHIQGLGVLSRRYGIPIYATLGTIKGIQNCKSLGDIDAGLLLEIQKDDMTTIGDLAVKPFSISHDAFEPTGFRIQGEGKAVGIATDLGMYDSYIVEQLKDLDAVILEANHDVHMVEVGKYPYPLKRRVLGNKGHLSNELSGRLLCQILHSDLKYICLGHLSKDNNFPELAYETVKLEVTMGNTPFRGDDIPLEVLARDEMSKIMHL